MNKLVALCIFVAAAGVGGAGGVVLRKSNAETSPIIESESASKEEGKHAKGQAHIGPEPKGHGAADTTGHGEQSTGSSFMKFSRQFVTPVIVDGRPESLIILDVSLEIDASLDGSIYSLEPRLRDAVLRVFLQQASTGSLARMFADPDVLETTRAMILEEVRAIAGEGVKSVLIMDVGYQPY